MDHNKRTSQGPEGKNKISTNFSNGHKYRICESNINKANTYAMTDLYSRNIEILENPFIQYTILID
jgi:hypothetical protein